MAKKKSSKKATLKQQASKEILTLPEFAKRLNVSRNQIYYYIKRDMISVIEKGGRKYVEYEKALAQLEAHIDKTAKAKGDKNKGNSKPGTSKTKVVQHEAPKYKGLSTADAERKEKFYKASLAELKYQEQAGQLVKAEEVERKAFAAGRKVRDKILSIPGRLAHELAAETDPHKLEIKLKKELTNALLELVGANGS